MSKIIVTVEAAKLRDLVYTETYTNKNGEEVKTQKVKFELIEVKEPKTVYNGNWYELVKTHFASKVQTKEEREAKAETVFLGEGVSIVWANDKSNKIGSPDNVSQNEADIGNLPF